MAGAFHYVAHGEEPLSKDEIIVICEKSIHGRWVSDFGYQVSGIWFRVLGLRFRVPGSKFRISGSWFRVPGFGSEVPGSGFRIPGLRFRVPGFTLLASAFHHEAHGEEPERRISRSSDSDPPLGPL